MEERKKINTKASPSTKVSPSTYECIIEKKDVETDIANLKQQLSEYREQSIERKEKSQVLEIAQKLANLQESSKILLAMLNACFAPNTKQTVNFSIDEKKELETKINKFIDQASDFESSLLLKNKSQKE